MFYRLTLEKHELMLEYVIYHNAFEIDLYFSPVVAKNDEFSTVCLGVLAAHGMILISIGYFICGITLVMQVLV